MFCTNCGAQLADTANFCVGCGGRVHRAEPSARPSAAPPPPAAARPTPPASAAPPAHEVHPNAQTKCVWCGGLVEAGARACPLCGATLSGPSLVTESGWAQLPGRKDMAKLQFGNSFCQIEGNYVPVADMNLASGDGVYFSHHVLLWKDSQIAISAMSLKGAWNRVFAGMPLVMTQAQGPGHIAFSRDDPGELIAMPLQPGQAVDVREHLFLAATLNVTYDWFATNIWFTTKNGDDTETHYPVGMNMDRFYAAHSPGLLLLHAGGNIFVRQLAAQQTILVKPTALIFKDPTVQMHLHFERPATGFTAWGSWGNRYLWLRLTGPGRVAIQSVFERIEGESRNITNFSYATEYRW